ncbi:L-ribulose-5-phosphate 4-epimerase [Vallitalea guaymasensis]|uniref:L-ribulose-5-phosphate 4-epimerase n=1 Tax=Vallitalea guaymasensis TaxID=1185412 RepID=UPI00272B367E|nr:L-ribulose-5-phosphate 4-epimerase [Vallitalea guaymasensis]
MLEKLKQEVLEANLELPKKGLVVYTWGNVSGIDRDKNLVVIKPSGVKYEDLTIDKLVVIDLDGNVVEGDYKPSSDTATHLELYKAFEEIGGVAHTHSEWATSYAQAGVNIPPLGTTHADYFYGAIPCTRAMRAEEIQKEYEKQTGKVIIETFDGHNPMEVPAVLVKEHGPFTWGTDAHNAVYNSVVLEEVAKMAVKTFTIKNDIFAHKMSQDLLDKHYLRKHGDNAYYGQ